MIPNLSTLRIGRAQRVHAPSPLAAPLGMEAMDDEEFSDQEEAYHEELEQAALAERWERELEYANEKNYWPAETYTLMASDPTAKSQSTYHKNVAMHDKNQHVESALRTLRALLYGVYVSHSQLYLSLEKYVNDIREFKFHYDKVQNNEWKKFLEGCARSIIEDNKRQAFTDAFVQMLWA